MATASEPATGAPGQSRAERIEALVGAARDGDREALGTIVTELTPLLWQVARAAGLSGPDAEDVLQTVWIRLLDHLAGIRDTRALTSWLVVTTRHESWRVRRAGRRSVPADTEWFSLRPGQQSGAEELVIAADGQRALWEALGRLEPPCPELLRIVAFVPRPDYTAVAARMGMKRGSVGPTRIRCLAKLRNELARGAGGGGL